MKVFKFGGASLRNADAIRNMAGIVQAESSSSLLVVVSAMGKTTNALEQLLQQFKKDGDWKAEIEATRNYHLSIIRDLLDSSSAAAGDLDKLVVQLMNDLQKPGVKMKYTIGLFAMES